MKCQTSKCQGYQPWELIIRVENREEEDALFNLFNHGIIVRAFKKACGVDSHNEISEIIGGNGDSHGFLQFACELENSMRKVLGEN